MKQTVTYQDLTNIEKDIHYHVNASPAFAIFNREKIKKFFSENNGRLSIARDKISSLMELHVNKDEKGVFKQRVMPEGPNKWDFKTEADAGEFKKEIEEFMKKQIEIFI